ncbi:Thioredoxin [Galdieria sulphuraria]|nr:Thioredoxin [Galdieria sulphuraria]
MVRQVSNLSEFDRVLKEAASKLVVVDFFAQWCGPCHFVAPFIDNFATKYPQVVFVKIDVDQASDVASSCGISAMPTFHFYKNSKKANELVGADPNTLENLIKKHMSSVESTEGYVLGRGESSNTINWNMGRTQQSANGERSSSNVVKPLYNEEYLKQLLEMGFPEVRAKRALLRTKHESVETAMNWLFEHMEDPDIDHPLEEEEAAMKETLKGSSLSEEEKRARAQEALERVRKKRQEEEKKAEIEKERNRMKTGKELAEAKAALEEQKRKAHVEKLQKEKIEAQKERERLRELLRQDRQERLARSGNNSASYSETQQQNTKPNVNSGASQSTGHQGPGVVQLRFPDGSKIEKST